MAKVLNPALLGNLISKYKADMLPYVDSDYLETFENELQNPTLGMFELYEKADFGRFFLNCLIDKDCIGDKILSDDKYVYFNLDTDKIKAVTGVYDADGYLFDNIYAPMFDEEHRKSDNELQYLEPEWDNGEEPEYYIRFDPVAYSETGISKCFELVICMDNRFFDYLADETDVECMEIFSYPYIEFARSQYKAFAEYAVEQIKEHIRNRLLEEHINGTFGKSVLKGNVFLQEVNCNGEIKHYIIGDYFSRIKSKRKIRWYALHDDIFTAIAIK